MKALVGAFNQEKALVGAFSVIVQPVVEPMDSFTALHCVHQDASKLHLVPSRHQRPLLYKPDLRTQAVWPLAELRALNRWTNKQSITGPRQASYRYRYGTRVLSQEWEKVQTS